jgi:DNA repair protein RadA/Sms
MPSSKFKYYCTNCGSVYTKWSGQCENCNEWNTIVEDQNAESFSAIKKSKDKSGKSSSSKIEFHSLDENYEVSQRFSSTISELDRVFGGGIVKGSATLVGGEPGIGKSTLLLQAAAKIADQGQPVIYITGEESIAQVSLRAKRLGLSKSNIKLAAATNLESIKSSLRSENNALVIIDSIQTMYLSSLDSAPGTVSQVRFCANELINMAKQSGFSLILVGHVTKEGQIAGPRVLEHMVDTVLYFEGDKGYNFRIIRAVKNRFGPANEIGVFEMKDKGLQEVKNPSSMFLTGKMDGVSGSVIFAGMEGTRPILVEIQALVTPSFMANPRRAVVGWDLNRLAMITAVLERRCAAKLHDKEIYLNIAGGIKINEPAADLAVAAAIMSASKDIPIKSNSVLFGEIGLSGEVRPVSRAEQRFTEAKKLGFDSAICNYDIEKNPNEEIKIKSLNTVLDLIDSIV